MPSDNKVTLQINLAPGDYRHAQHILPHQLKTLQDQVDEILLVVDTRPSKGRFAENWERNKTLLDDFLAAIATTNQKIKIAPVDYSPDAKNKVSAFFTQSGIIPDKDFRGGPFYCYFFGVYRAAHNLVFHLDSDIFLGGGSQAWLAEAALQLQQDNACFTVSPLPGPPHPADILVGQPDAAKVAPHMYHFNGMSTRLFMINRSVFESKKLRLGTPSLRNQIKATIEGNANAELPEILLSEFMRSNGLHRIDFLGSGAGLWSLHPPYRSANFYSALPDLIKKVTNNQLPQAQQGFYDIIDEVCDWTEARTKIAGNRWWKRLLK